MSGLRSALEELHGEDLSGIPDARLEEDFAELESAAEALEAERSRRLGEIDHRAAYRPQRRADALGEICRQWLDRPDRPEVGGERPHVTVTVDLDTLKEGNGPAELDHAGPVLSMMARRLACDSSITRVVLGPRSEPLDVGRRTSVVPPAMRRAVVARDRHCAFPACDRPHTWCDAHHVVHWADGGGTAVSNLVLLCRPHHRLVHESFGVRMVEGRPQFSRAPP